MFSVSIRGVFEVQVFSGWGSFEYIVILWIGRVSSGTLQLLVAIRMGRESMLWFDQVPVG